MDDDVWLAFASDDNPEEVAVTRQAEEAWLEDGGKQGFLGVLVTPFAC